MANVVSLLKNWAAEGVSSEVKDLTTYTYVNVQQTPNPEAQFPSEEPPLLEHSDAVKHVPYILVSDLAVHWLGGKSKSF